MVNARATSGRAQGDQLPVGNLEDKDLHRLVHEANAELLRRHDPEKVCAGNGIAYEATVDLALAAFYHFRGVPIVAIRHRDSGGGGRQQFRFVFGCSVAVAERLRIEYLNSDIRKFDDSMRVIKKMFHEAKESAAWNGR